MTSPSLTTYSLPSRRWRFLALTSFIVPARARSSKAVTSARMKPLARSVWILPAASTAVPPRSRFQPRTSGSPAVKKVMMPTAS